MDTAGSTSWDDFASRIIARMDQQEENIDNTGRVAQALVAQVSSSPINFNIFREQWCGRSLVPGTLRRDEDRIRLCGGG